MSDTSSAEFAQGLEHLGPVPAHCGKLKHPRIIDEQRKQREPEDKANAVPCVEIIQHFRGEPTSTKPHEWRWGNRGSLSVNLEKNRWFDHEANEGGDTLTFVERELRFSREAAIAWVQNWEKCPDAIPAAAGVNRPAPPLGRIIATYDYRHESGELLFQVVRFEPKDFRQRRPDGNGGWSWSIRGVPRVPYRLPELIRDVADHRVIAIVEGENDVDNLRKQGIPATCNPGGAGKWGPELSRYLSGAGVVLIPDNDQAGRNHMDKVGNALVGSAAGIRILNLRGLPEKGDVSDWLSAGGTIEELSSLIAHAPVWKQRAPFRPPEREAEDASTRSANSQDSAAESTDHQEEQRDHSECGQAHGAAEHKSSETPYDRLIDELASLDSITYDRRRQAAADELGIRIGTLDDQVKRRRAEHEQEARRKKAETNQTEDPLQRRGFRMNHEGLRWSDPFDSSSSLLLSGPFEVRAVTRDPHSNNWGVLLAWRDKDDREHTWVMPYSMLAGDSAEVFRHFLDGGLFISPYRQSRDKLIEFLISCEPSVRARCVDRAGWYRNDATVCYVFPDGEVIGQTCGEEIVLCTNSATRQPSTMGDLEGWKSNVAAPCLCNSRLITALSMSFVGPLLEPLGEESFGVHFEGKSSIGKTRLAHVAASSSGVEVRTWRTTDNSAESWCAEANDGLLPLDEISQADPRSLDALAYMVAQGSGKGRANRTGIARPVTKWRTVFISTGEIGLAEKVAEAGRRVRGGQLVRVIEVPADAGAGLGVFEHLHGSNDGAAFAETLKYAASQYKGRAGRAFVSSIVGRLPEVIAGINKARWEWIKAHVGKGADGEVQRVGSKFGLIAAAGELAVSILGLPWAKDAVNDAVAKCFSAWLEKRGGSEAHEILSGIAQVRRFIEQHGESRFSVLAGEDRIVANRAGWRQYNNGAWDYFIPPEVWKNEVCKGLNAKTIAGELYRKGILLGTGGKTSTTVNIDGIGKVRVYHLTSAILAEEPETGNTPQFT